MMLNADEIERLIRKFATPDEEIGWVGDQQMLDNAEEIAGFIVDNYNDGAS